MKIIAVLAVSVVGIIILPAMSFLHARNRKWAGSRIRQDAQPKKASFANPVLELEIRHESGVTAIAFSPDNSLLAIGADDYTIQLWDARTGQVERRLNEPDRDLRAPGGYPDGQKVYSLAFSPDGKTLASAGDIIKDNLLAGGQVTLWEIPSGNLLRSPDGKMLASCVGPGLPGTTGQIEPLLKVHLWDVETGQSNPTPVSHSDFVTAVAFSPDGWHLASGGEGLYSLSSHRHEGGAVKIWRIK
jgi:hypothetical protein